MGSVAEIDHLPVTESKDTGDTGSMVEPRAPTPNGNLREAITQIKKKAQEGIKRVKEEKLYRQDVWLMLDCQFWPRVSYGLCCNIARYDELEDGLQKEYWTLLPIGGVIRSSPVPIRQIYKGLYRGGCPHLGIECSIG